MLPTLIAFNVAPSATFFNQAAALVGWGGFLLVLGTAIPKAAWPRSPAALLLLAALALLLLAALGASIFGAVPWSLVAVLGRDHRQCDAGHRDGRFGAARRRGEHAFRAFCIAFIVAGLASSLIGLVQVFAPTLPDGDWLAISSIPGRATGNLRQPNHLSSLLLWSIVARGLARRSEVAAGRAHDGARAGLHLRRCTDRLSHRRGGHVDAGRLGPARPPPVANARRLLVLAPLAYAAMWGARRRGRHTRTRLRRSGTFRQQRHRRLASLIWSNALALIASHPWLGVGFGDFNFAWTLTPFPGRPAEFFDHTHDLVLNFAVELGIPLAALVLGLMLYAMWVALRNAIVDGRQEPRRFPVQRAVFVIVFLVAVHSMLEYPLWYAYFLLPTAFAFGLCLERPTPGEFGPGAVSLEGNVTRPYVLASMFLILGGMLAVYDYFRVVVIFEPPANPGPLEQRIAEGRRSILFAHHADYAAATVAAHPGQVMSAFERAPHYLLDARLLIAWVKALGETGQIEKARYVAARLKEFRNDQAEGFFAACTAASAASAAKPTFQCQPPQQALRFEDFR